MQYLAIHVNLYTN